MVKRFFLAVILTAISTFSFAQEVKEVTLVVNGDGATKEEATHAALRSAIEQAFGTFVSANTTILNDELVKDEIATISSGNIQKYTELGSYTLPNGNTSVSLQATVSIGKLVTYAKSKGSECEFAGAIFGANIKMLKLKYENSKKAFANLVQYIKEVGPSVFDKRISARDPQANSGVYEVMLTVYFDTNANTFAFYDHVMSTMRAIGLTEEERELLYPMLGSELNKELYYYEYKSYYPAYYCPVYNKKGLNSYLAEYCFGNVISTNLGEISQNIYISTDDIYLYDGDLDYREMKKGTLFLAEVLSYRMFDYFIIHKDTSKYKDEYLRRGFYYYGEYVSNDMEYDQNIYIWKQNRDPDPPRIGDRKKVYVDWYYQVPITPLNYEYRPSVDELSKTTGFFVK